MRIAFNEIARLTHKHPHAKADPSVIIQHQHQVDVNENAHCRQKGNERNLRINEKRKPFSRRLLSSFFRRNYLKGIRVARKLLPRLDGDKNADEKQQSSENENNCKSPRFARCERIP